MCKIIKIAFKTQVFRKNKNSEGGLTLSHFENPWSTTSLIISLTYTTVRKKYHKVRVGCYHGDNMPPSFLKLSTQNTFIFFKSSNSRLSCGFTYA